MPPSSDFSPKLPPQIPNSLYANPLWIFKGQLPPKGNPWPSSPNQLHPWSSRIISSWSLHLSSFGSTLRSHPWFSLSLTKTSQASEQVLSAPSSVCVQNLATFPHLRGYRVVPPTRAGEVVSLLPSLPCFSLFSIWQPESHLQNISSDYPFLYSKHGNFSCKMDSCYLSDHASYCLHSSLTPFQHPCCSEKWIPSVWNTLFPDNHIATSVTSSKSLLKHHLLWDLPWSYHLKFFKSLIFRISPALLQDFIWDLSPLNILYKLSLIYSVSSKWNTNPMREETLLAFCTGISQVHRIEPGT